MSSRRRLIEEINRHCKNNSLLIVSSSNKLIRIKCPFWVVAVKNIDIFSVGDHCMVDAVKMDQHLTLIYIINDTGYKYYFFMIDDCY